MDLFSPNRVASLSGKFYAFVIVDDYSRFTWAAFPSHKNDALNELIKFCKRFQNEKGYVISSIRSDRGTEIINQSMNSFCEENRILIIFWCLECHNEMVL